MVILLLLDACDGSIAARCASGAVLSTEQVQFGDVKLGRSGSATLEVRNEGACPYTLAAAELDDDAAGDGFEVSFTRPEVVEPGGTASIELGFSPSQLGEFESQLLVQLDESAEELSVALSGERIPGRGLEFSPEALHFQSPVGCVDEAPMTLRNAGAAEYQLADIRLDDATHGFTVDLDDATNGPLPWNLAPGEKRTVSVAFAPTDESPASVSLSVTGADAASPSTAATIEGEGYVYDSVTWTYTWHSGVDIVVAVDTSASMSEGTTAPLAALDAAWPSLITALEASGSNYQLVVVTEGGGCVTGASVPFVTPDLGENEQANALAEMVVPDFAHAEEGFTLLSDATAPAAVASGGCNEGLLRPGMGLHLLGITDDAEQSAGSWEDYVSAFEGRVVSPADLVIHTIGGDWPSGCEEASPSAGWYEATSAHGGYFLSVCGDLDAELTMLGEAMGSGADLTFPLTYGLIDESIVVTIDGVESHAWTYEGLAQLTLDEAPREGATVTISGYPACP